MTYNTYLFTGTTGIGKTKAAISLARKLLNHEENLLILSIDSRKAYKELNIGTNKFAFLKHIKKLKDLARNRKIKLVYCGIDLFEPHEQINAFEFYKRLILQCQHNTNYEQLLSRKFKTIIFGGTLLYIKPILGLPLFDNPGKLQYLRNILENLDLKKIQDMAITLDINLQNLNNAEQNNKKRLIRKIEVQVLKNEVYLGTLMPDLENLCINFEKNKLKQEYSKAQIQYAKDKKDLEQINKFIKTITPQPLKTYIFVPKNILDKTYITKLVKRIFTMFELGFAKEVATLMQEYSQYTQNNPENTQPIPAFSIMGYDTLYNFLKNAQNPPKFAQNIDQYYSSLTKMQLNAHPLPEFIAEYYIKHHYLGLKKIAENLTSLITTKAPFINAKVSKEISIYPLLQIFKKHLNYAKYQKQSVKSILHIESDI